MQYLTASHFGQSDLGNCTFGGHNDCLWPLEMLPLHELHRGAWLGGYIAFKGYDQLRISKLVIAHTDPKRIPGQIVDGFIEIFQVIWIGDGSRSTLNVVVTRRFKKRRINAAALPFTASNNKHQQQHSRKQEGPRYLHRR